MKVLFLSNLFPDSSEPYRGLDNATLLHELSNRAEIRVIAARPTLPWKQLPEKKPRDVDALFSPVYCKTPYVPKVGSLVNHRLFASAIRGPMQQLRQRFRFDIILSSWTYPDTAAVAIVAGEMNVPFVNIVQGSDAHVYVRMKWRRPIIVSALNRSPATITRSAKLAELLADAGVDRKRLHCIYNGVDLETFRPIDRTASRQQLGLPTDLPILVFVGNFLPVKNPLLLVRAHALVCKQRPCYLVMIGGGPMEAEVRRTADELGFGKNVILAGRKLAAQVAGYMQAADLLCLSSVNEGLPNVILEALASGLPVVSTNVGGISEVVAQDYLGQLVPSNNLQSLAAAISTALQKEPEREKIRRYAENFSWKKAADKYYQLLQNAAGDNR